MAAGTCTGSLLAGVIFHISSPYKVKQTTDSHVQTKMAASPPAARGPPAGGGVGDREKHGGEVGGGENG